MSSLNSCLLLSHHAHTIPDHPDWSNQLGIGATKPWRTFCKFLGKHKQGNRFVQSRTSLDTRALVYSVHDINQSQDHKTKPIAIFIKGISCSNIQRNKRADTRMTQICKYHGTEEFIHSLQWILFSLTILLIHHCINPWPCWLHGTIMELILRGSSLKIQTRLLR